MIPRKIGDLRLAIDSRWHPHTHPPPPPQVVRNYGRMLVELAGAVPDGIVAFFVSYSYMDSIVSKWNDMGILQVGRGRQVGRGGAGRADGWEGGAAAPREARLGFPQGLRAARS